MLRISLLGAPAIDVDGQPLAVDTRKATALAAYLAVEGGAHSRDSLAGLLWPDYEQERSRAALRRTLSTLRTAVGGETLVVERDAVALERSRLELDIDEFRRRAADPQIESLEAAVALHRGPFMAGFGIRDSATFDDWQSFNSATLARELGAALDRAADACAARGDWPRALEHARRRLALDELHEPAHRRLMQLYAASGERSAAFDQYRDCVRVLHRELGVAPLDTTTALYRAIREGSVHPVETRPAPALPEHAGHPFVGRASEWQKVRDAYSSVGPDGHLVVIEGETGIGKTRLGEELLGWARGEGAVAVSTRCFEDERGLAFGSVLDLLRAALRDGDAGAIEPSAAAEAARLLPELGTPPTRSLDDPGAHARFVEGVVQTLLAAAHGEQPPVVLVDDVHWADASSLEVLAYLARRLRGTAVPPRRHLAHGGDARCPPGPAPAGRGEPTTGSARRSSSAGSSVRRSASWSTRQGSPPSWSIRSSPRRAACRSSSSSTSTRSERTRRTGRCPPGCATSSRHASRRRARWPDRSPPPRRCSAGRSRRSSCGTSADAATRRRSRRSRS